VIEVAALEKPPFNPACSTTKASRPRANSCSRSPNFPAQPTRAGGSPCPPNT